MVTETKTIKCDCEQGKLEEIASTQLEWGPGMYDSGIQTTYYSCNNCETIFKRQRTVSGNWTGNDPDKFSEYEPYKGSLTQKELIRQAPKHYGKIPLSDEEKRRESWSKLINL